MAATRHEVEVVKHKPGATFELLSVSPRLKGALVHPSKTAWLVGLRYSPDGQRLIAGDYPGGIVQLWDAESGQQLTRIETGYGYRGSSEYLHLTPDWRTLYVSRNKRNPERIEKDGKKMFRWTFASDIRAWDLATGEVQKVLQHDPPRGIMGIQISPDGTKLVSVEELPGEAEGSPKRSATLWDVKTGEHRELVEGLQPYQYMSSFSPDGRTLAAPTDPASGPLAIKLIDVATGNEKLSIPITENNAQRVAYLIYSPDGKLLIGQVRDEAKTDQHSLKWWDPTTGREVASFEGEPKKFFLWMAVSSDSQTLAVTNFSRERSDARLFLFDLVGKTLIKSVQLSDKGMAFAPAFSPDGRWVAVSTQEIPVSAREPAAEDLPQPRIHLLEAATGQVRETIIAPQAVGVQVCFSPDGKTLASGGNGKVLLWDMTQPPGAFAASER